MSKETRALYLQENFRPRSTPGSAGFHPKAGACLLPRVPSLLPVYVEGLVMRAMESAELKQENQNYRPGKQSYLLMPLVALCSTSSSEGYVA